jgi:hypothetical protein
MVKKIEKGFMGLGDQVTVSVESIEGPRRSATLWLTEGDGRLFGYGDEVVVEIAHMGRKVGRP